MATSGPSLGGVDLKIAQARSHVAEVRRLVQSTVDPANVSFAQRVDPTTGEIEIVVHGMPVIPPELPLVVGDALFNLRSALDHLAWQLTLLDGGMPGQRTQFPLRRTNLDKQGNIVPLVMDPPISDQRILDLIEDVQPYRAPDNGEGPSTSLQPYHQSHLWMMSELNNIDKHRLLLLVVCTLDVGHMWWGEDKPRNLRVKTSPALDGEPVAWFDFGGNPPPGFDPHPSLHVAFREPTIPAVWHVDVDQLLDNFVFWVADYIVGWRFRKLFP